MTTKTKKNWRTVRLGDVVEIIDGDRGANYPGNGELLSSGHSIFLNTKNVSGTKFDFTSNVQFISLEKDNSLGKGRLKRGDFVLTTRGTIGNFAQYGENIPYDHVRINSGMVILRPIKDVIDASFFDLFLSGQVFKKQITSLQSGSAQPQLPIRDLQQFELILPPIKEQTEISNLLLPFDEKIESNNRIIKTLEEMAQAIFKEWFVNFRFPGYEKSEFTDSPLGRIPKGWEIKNLGEVVELAYGKALKEEVRTPGTVVVVGSSGVVGAHNQKLVSGPGIVVGRKGVAGSVIWIDTDFYPIDTTFYVKTDLPLTFCFYMLRQLGFLSGDSAVPGLSREDAYRYQTIIPTEGLLTEFHGIVESLFQKRYKLDTENQKLAAMRDLLLPRLMSGELQV